MNERMIDEARRSLAFVFVEFVSSSSIMEGCVLWEHLKECIVLH